MRNLAQVYAWKVLGTVTIDGVKHRRQIGRRFNVKQAALACADLARSQGVEDAEVVECRKRDKAMIV